MAWSAYNVHPTLILSQLGSDVPKLQSEIVIRGRAIEDLQAAANRAWAEAEANRSRYADAAGSLVAVKNNAYRKRRLYKHQAFRLKREPAHEKLLYVLTRQRLRRTLKYALRERTELGQRLIRFNVSLATARQHGIELERLLNTVSTNADRERHEHERKMAALVIDLRNQRSHGQEGVLPGNKITDRSNNNAPHDYIGKLYSAKLIEKGPLIHGRPGLYYKIKLLDQSNREIPVFDLGKLQPGCVEIPRSR